MTDPKELLARLAADLVRVLGGQLLSLTPHGSWALGDFTVGRSDLDLLAVLATDPSAATLVALVAVHARLTEDFPDWDGRVEVEYVSVEAINAVVHGTKQAHRMISVGPGTPLQEVEASRHYVLNWAAARQADRPLVGAAPSALLPAIDQPLVHQVILEHVRAWPRWLDDMRHTGAQAYTVLTLCRAAEALATTGHVSKLAAARAGVSRFPEWSGLIDWARKWWYDGGSDLDHPDLDHPDLDHPDLDQGRFDDVRRFVEDISARLLRDYDTPPDSGRDSAESSL